MRRNRLIARVAAAPALLAAGLVAVAQAVAAPPVIPDSNADTFVLYSAWATQNDVDSVDCVGISPAVKIPTATAHASFRCKVEVQGNAAGTIVAKALGPEWFRITSVTGGKLKPDGGVGALPKGPASVDFSAAGTALENSAWGKAHDVDTAFCLGVGAYTMLPAQNRFFAFSCATLNTFASRGPHVLITVSAKGVASVVRVLAP